MAKKMGGARPGAGRPPGAHNKITADVKALAQQYAPDAVKELARIALKSANDTARVSAIKEILDRAYGKSVQAVQNLDENGNPAAAPGMRVVVELVGEPAAPRETLSNRPALSADVVRRNVQLVG